MGEIKFKSQISIPVPPTEDSHVVRLDELKQHRTDYSQHMPPHEGFGDILTWDGVAPAWTLLGLDCPFATGARISFDWGTGGSPSPAHAPSGIQGVDINVVRNVELESI